jgi:hypothetical protein
MNVLNLDQKAAQYAQNIIANSLKAGSAKEVENLITKTLGVLQEQGVYAMILFLFSRTSKEEKIAPHMREQLYALLQELPAFADKKDKIDAFDKNTKAEEALKFYSDSVCNDLHTLLLVKDVYEQTLIYARYGAKAAAKEEK